METNPKEMSELLEFIETNKHNVMVLLRSVVLDPIQSMNMPEAASEFYAHEVGRRNEEVLRMATEIMTAFSMKWRDTDEPEEQQLLSMKRHIAEVVSRDIPRIREVVSFYSFCVNKKYFFEATGNGNEALEKMTVSVSMSDRVCDKLLRLEGDRDEGDLPRHKYNLLEMLQEGLDGIEAEVHYHKEWESAGYGVCVNSESFLDNVLINIRENINTHAFGTLKFKKKFVWEKRVDVEIEEKDCCYVVSISNNGEPFTGDVSKVFDYGYCHGKMKHSGIGMYSIRKSMRQMGGDAEFGASNRSKTVTYKLTLPR